ncbi:MAG: hypothetical protein ACRECP_10370 [Methylocella sp.]
MNEGRRRIAHKIEPWFFLVLILSMPQANFHVWGLAGRLTRPAEAGGSNVSLAGLRAHARWRDWITHRFKVSLRRAGRSIGDHHDAARIV